MPWARFDDNLPFDQKIVSIDNDAFALWTCAIAYANHNLTDGVLKTHEIVTLRALRRVPEIAVESLIDVGLWERADDGIQIHNFLKYNKSRAQVTAEREDTARRQAEWRANHPSNGGRNSVSNGVMNSVSNAAPVPIPVPGPGPLPEPNPGPIQDEISSAKPPTAPDGAKPVKAKKATNDYSVEFEAFWLVYPRKEDKFKAWKAYQKHLKARTSPDEIELGATHYAEVCRLRGTAPTYIKMPATFLNDLVYEDYQQKPDPAKILPRQGGTNGSAKNGTYHDVPAAPGKYDRFSA